MQLAERGVAKLRHLVGGVYAHGVEAALSLAREMPFNFEFTRLASQSEFLEHAGRTETKRSRDRDVAQALAEGRETFRTPGFCYVCSRWTRFSSSWAWSYEVEGRNRPNWREHLVCSHCNLSNRMRASLHLASATGVPLEELHAYATEQVTPLFTQLKNRCLSVVGSEYLGDTVAHGACNAAGIMNQDLTSLTFPDEQFDLVLSFEVLEHVPDYMQAFRECARVLRPGGRMLFSAPFNAHSARNLIRARLRDDRTVEHLLPPEYHGDPLNSEGCLCFQTFGWEMLEQVKHAGFVRVSALLYHSVDYGYLGENQIQFLAQK